LFFIGLAVLAAILILLGARGAQSPFPYFCIFGRVAYTPQAVEISPLHSSGLVRVRSTPKPEIGAVKRERKVLLSVEHTITNALPLILSDR
jgi:hypothetical protein